MTNANAALTDRQIALTYRTLRLMAGIQAEAAVQTYADDTLARLIGVALADVDFGTRRQRMTGTWMARMLRAEQTRRVNRDRGGDENIYGD